ncbi:3-oxoacyl-[acyl-carrier protein] reductase [Ureibacillus xyleni]|uniref:3-oxoacyl-[acyl-carrier protein] reductase n=1 Tax=Ureibacillus xyleni TaxID=614648 RepID=A0A285TPU1_9BACL|nr:SDR family oxidoreductase [Ureibacillus xyleni]SOC25278.1 3-oxoacyl-[acyl-carrier protein] reductase [Ureibacillus xyleni]
MDLHLEKKNVLITGGSKGIGLEIAKRFVEEKANVSIVGRDIEYLNKAKDLLGNITIYQSDITNHYERSGLIDKYLLDHGHIDILVNNAGGSNGGEILETPMEKFYEAFELNYFSVVDLSKQVIKSMKKQKSGSILNISSIYGRESGGKVTYNNSKAALISFTKALSSEVIQYGIRVNSIAPGSIIHESSIWEKLSQEKQMEIETFLDTQIPAKRFGTPEEIANVAVFLASDQASWIVGATINVDGGQSKMNF